jgi:hypothetical protein
MACSVQGRQKRARQVKSEAKSIINTVFEIKRVVHKELVLARQTVNSAYCCDVLWQMCEELDIQDAFKKWRKHWERCIRAEGDYFEGDGDQ